jgi:hypothetical protein
MVPLGDSHFYEHATRVSNVRAAARPQRFGRTGTGGMISWSCDMEFMPIVSRWTEHVFLDDVMGAPTRLNKAVLM